MGLARRAKKLGIELFVLDDGWFGNRNDDNAGLGDYTVNPKNSPEDLHVLQKNTKNGLGIRLVV